jgi:hypothetical protein
MAVRSGEAGGQEREKVFWREQPAISSYESLTSNFNLRGEFKPLGKTRSTTYFCYYPGNDFLNIAKRRIGEARRRRHSFSLKNP